MPNAAHTIREELHGVLAFVGAVWAVFLLSLILPKIDDFGLVPRTWIGLLGIVTMPFLHKDWGHLLGNTVPLLVLLMLLAGSRARSGAIVVGIVLLGGGLLWLCGRTADHIGASGLIFGLVVFLILSGVLERRPIPLLVAVVVAFLYGGSLLWSVLPTAGADVSWDGHLCGAIAGGLMAYGLTRKPDRATSDESEPALS